MFKIIIFVIFCVIASIFAECPKGSERFGSKCYQFFKNSQEYRFAAIHCSSLYGFRNNNLTSIHDLSENFYIHDTASIAFNGSSDDIWIGGIYVPDDPDQWIWEDKSNFSWTNWKNDDPINDTQFKHRVSMDLSTGLWLSSNMNERKPFVCQVYERDEKTTTTVTLPITTVTLPTTTVTLSTTTITLPTTKTSTKTTVILPTTTTVTVTPPSLKATVTLPTTTVTLSTTTVTPPTSSSTESNKSCDDDDNKSIVAFCNRTLAKLQKGVTVWYCCKNECFQGELRKLYCTSD